MGKIWANKAQSADHQPPPNTKAQSHSADTDKTQPLTFSGNLTQENILILQRRFGNRFVQRLLTQRMGQNNGIDRGSSEQQIPDSNPHLISQGGGSENALMRKIVRVHKNSAPEKNRNAEAAVSNHEVDQMIDALQQEHNGDPVVDFYQNSPVHFEGNKEHWLAGHGDSASFDNLSPQEFYRSITLEDKATLHLISCRSGVPFQFAQGLAQEISDKDGAKEVTITGATGLLFHTPTLKGVFNDRGETYESEVQQPLEEGEKEIDKSAVQDFEAALVISVNKTPPESEAVGKFFNKMDKEESGKELLKKQQTSEFTPLLIDQLKALGKEDPSAFIKNIHTITKRQPDAEVKESYKLVLGKIRKAATVLWGTNEERIKKWSQGDPGSRIAEGTLGVNDAKRESIMKNSKKYRYVAKIEYKSQKRTPSEEK